MFVTAAVFQSAIGPYVVAAVTGSVSHANAAVPMFASSSCAATCAGSTRSRARPARRCDRRARAHLHRKRHDVVHRRATHCNEVRVASSCNEEQHASQKTCRNTRYCGALNVPQHTVLQQACRNTSIQPEDNALMQPFAKDACALVARKLPGQATPPKPRCNILLLPHACCTTVDTDLLHNHCRVRQAVRQAAM